tara:strand:- start:4169 stop:4636 length:468 start_codon:yes stop_codon:yes gene_type:complete
MTSARVYPNGAFSPSSPPEDARATCVASRPLAPRIVVVVVVVIVVVVVVVRIVVSSVIARRLPTRAATPPRVVVPRVARARILIVFASIAHRALAVAVVAIARVRLARARGKSLEIIRGCRGCAPIVTASRASPRRRRRARDTLARHRARHVRAR